MTYSTSTAVARVIDDVCGEGVMTSMLSSFGHGIDMHIAWHARMHIRGEAILSQLGSNCLTPAERFFHNLCGDC